MGTITELATKIAKQEEALWDQLAEARAAEGRGDYPVAWTILSDAIAKLRRTAADGVLEAETYLHAGRLRGWLSGSDQSGDQESAKDLLTHALDIFTRLRFVDKAAEVALELGSCDWRNGEVGNAQAYYTIASRAAGRLLQARAQHGLGLCAKNVGDLTAAIDHLRTAIGLTAEDDDPNIVFRIYNNLATTYRALYEQTGNRHYSDEALLAYAGASTYCAAAGNERYLAVIETGLGNIHLQLGMLPVAMKHLAAARAIAERIPDQHLVASVDECRARGYLAEGQLDLAARIARNAVRIFTRGKQIKALCEALTTQGTVLARSGKKREAREVFRRSIQLGQEHLLTPQVCFAGLALCEELQGWLSLEEFNAAYLVVDEATGEHDQLLLRRLRQCARYLAETLLDQAIDTDSAASLDDAVRTLERNLIQRALDEAQGSVTRAARSLGMTHQRLINRIDRSHPELATTRKPARTRRSRMIT